MLNKLKNITRSAIRSSLFFPTLVVIILFVLTAFKISGTSIGIYDTYLNGQPSSSLIANNPEPIRSDEWLVTTQLTIAQKEAGFPRINPNINGGRDMSLITDVPYKGWSAMFKPQNFSFFLLPLEYAFAFKWWFLIGALIISTYYLALHFMPKKPLLSVLTSLALSLNPFVFWWYQTITIMPMAWGLVIILICLKLVDRKSLHIFGRWSHRSLVISKLFLLLALVYAIVSFALILYPPFQIPIVIAATAFILGYVLNSESHLFSKKAFLRITRRLAPLLMALVFAGSIIGLFYVTRSDAIHAITNTVYPGKRTVTSGNYVSDLTFIGYSEVMLQSSESVKSLIPAGASSVATFIILSTVFLVPITFIEVFGYLKQKRMDWVSILIIVVNLLFLAHLFLPLFNGLAQFMLLDLVPKPRLIIGFGFLGILSMIYLLYKLESLSVRPRDVYVFTVSYGFALFVTSIVAGAHFSQDHPGYITLRLLIMFCSLFVLGIALLFPKKSRLVGISVLVILGFGSIFKINPIYIGLGSAYNSNLLDSIRQFSKPESRWGVAGNLYLENAPIMAGVASETATLFYPNSSFWESVAPGDSATYNRYAHVLLAPNQPEVVHLVQADFFTAQITCSNELNNKVTNILSDSEIDLSCYHLIKRLDYPATTLYIYQRNTDSI